MKSNVGFDQLSPQSGIVRRERGVESRDHKEVKGETLRDGGENRGSSECLQTKGIERVENGVEGRQARKNEKMEDGGERRQTRGGRDKVGWLGRVMEEDQKKPMVWACARQ